ncbi:MAG: HAMP domain-containing protein [Bryobacteraceae bacterium]|nr:HAMP domain-containing protein [Bryobacteraceae bacterium]
MKSIRAKILIWCFSILVGSLVALVGVAFWQARSNNGPTRFIRQVMVTQAEQALRLAGEGKREELRAYLASLDRHLGGQHRVVDAAGRDYLTGANHSEMLSAARQPPSRPPILRGEIVMATSIPGQRSIFLVSRPPPMELLSQIPYFLLILSAMALFCWILAVDIAGPLRKIAEGVSRFGAGDLDTRLQVQRRDEIGQLGQTFDQMAGRIQSLVGAERQLLQDISHELRSPLARLGVSIQLAKRPGQRGEAFEQMEREVGRLGELVGDLVAMTRAEGDTNLVRREWVRLDVLLQDIVETCQLEATVKRSRLSLAEPTEAIELAGNGELLWRAVENVTRNAIRHGPAGSDIEISLRRTPAGDAEVTVRDYGSGLAEEDLTRIFLPFYRTDPSRTTDTGGVGLGLSIAQRAVNLHHGRILAENASPGLRVRITLPVQTYAGALQAR